MNLNKILTFFGVLLFVTLCVFMWADKVPAGHVGIKVHLLGSDKGVDSEELTPGRYWLTMNEELYLFPTFTQTYSWTKDSIEGSETDESISFQTVEGLVVGADIGISYNIEPLKVNDVFQKYRKGVSEITDVYLRNIVRNELVTAASRRPIESVYGAGKSDLLSEVETNVRNQIKGIGINIEKLYWINELRLPSTVTAALNAKITATQMAAQRQNEVAQAKAEADKTIEVARGSSESTLLIAKAEAEAIRIKGQALSENPKLTELSAIEKWNGVLPQYQLSSSTPFINIK